MKPFYVAIYNLHSMSFEVTTQRTDTGIEILMRKIGETEWLEIFRGLKTQMRVTDMGEFLSKKFYDYSFPEEVEVTKDQNLFVEGVKRVWA